MTDVESFEARLREAWASTPPAGSGDGCDAAATIWSAAQGDRPAAETQRLVDHVAACGRCADAWRLARLLAPPARMARTWRPAVLALAASVLLAAVVFVPWKRWTTAPVEWRGEQHDVMSLLDESAALPRDACVLRWSAGPRGTRYALTFSTLDGSLDRTIHELVEPRYVIPAEDLRGVPPRATLLWRVTGVLPDGRERASVTFRATVE